MANCLVTKLKEVVNDVEIPVLGELILKIRPNSGNGNAFAFTTSTVPQTLKVLKGHIYTDGTYTTAYPEVNEVASGYTRFEGATKGNEEVIVSISNKYKFYLIQAKDRIDLSFEDLYFTDFTELYFAGSKYISGDIEELIEHLVDLWVKNGRTIDLAYPVYLQFAGTNARFKGSIDWWSKTWGLTIIKDTNNTKVYNIYAAETDAGGGLLPQSQQYTRLAATYNYETKVWTYTDLF